MTSGKVKTRYKILLTIAFLLGALALALAVLPWKTAVEKKLQQALETKGFQHVRLTLSDINFNSATLRDVMIGEEDPIILKNLTLLYSPFELWHGNLRALTINGLSIDVRQSAGKWSVQGLKKQKGGESFRLPVTPDQISSIPLDHLTIEDSQINIVTDTWKTSLPMKLEWTKTPTPEISLQTAPINFKSDGLTTTIEKADIDIGINAPDNNWQGFWTLKDIKLEAGDIQIPIMLGTGTAQADAENVTLSGQLKSKDAAHHAAFTLNYPQSAPEKAALKLTQATMPWHGGKLSLKNSDIPLAGNKPIKLNIEIDKVSIDEFMQALTGERMSATGVVSGTLPLIIGRDGSLSFGQGALKADSPGTIVIPAELIPGDNEQITLTREILKNFHYNVLSLSINTDKDNNISILMALGGNNPDVLEGQAVKLNINLSGDILDFIRQNAMLITDPQKILKQERK